MLCFLVISAYLFLSDTLPSSVIPVLTCRKCDRLCYSNASVISTHVLCMNVIIIKKLNSPNADQLVRGHTATCPYNGASVFQK